MLETRANERTYMIPQISKKENEELTVDASLVDAVQHYYESKPESDDILNEISSGVKAKNYSLENSAFAVMTKKAGEYPTPTAEQNKRLLELCRNGDMDARDALINHNMKLVISIASKYKSNLPVEDLVQEGVLGMIHAIEKFDITCDYNFSTYAVWWIKQAISRYIQNNQTAIRIPVHQYETENKINKAVDRCYSEGNLNPSDEEIAKYAGITVEKLNNNIESINAVKRIASLEENIGSAEDILVGNLVKDNKAVTSEQIVSDATNKQMVNTILSGLSDKEKSVVSMFYGLNDGPELTVKEIAPKFNMTEKQVRDQLTRTLKKLKGLCKKNTAFIQTYCDEHQFA